MSYFGRTLVYCSRDIANIFLQRDSILIVEHSYGGRSETLGRW